ncbi:MAG TPA: TetR family transcriptional regulator [Acidimicrobiales bacterium]|nr:TetR family transcriptional regulator [Acidimicrobiales bacterium]
MARPGRRPGKADTRAEIVAAARAAFAELGYERASIRGIARRASVDPALVHHYFADKSELYIETMHLPIDPHQVQAEVVEGAGGFSGERLVERFLAQWEMQSAGADSTSFVTLAQAVTASPQTADAMREFLNERLTFHGFAGEDDDTQRRRRALVSSQLIGVAWNRYVMRLEPMASADRRDIARWVGPTIDRYARGALEPPGDTSS